MSDDKKLNTVAFTKEELEEIEKKSGDTAKKNSTLKYTKEQLEKIEEASRKDDQ